MHWDTEEGGMAIRVWFSVASAGLASSLVDAIYADCICRGWLDLWLHIAFVWGRGWINGLQGCIVVAYGTH